MGRVIASLRQRPLTRSLALAWALVVLAPASPAHALAGVPTTTTAAPTSTGGGVSTSAIAIAAVAGVVALTCLAWAIARRRAFEPHWLLSLRHSLAEAGYRASETWGEFADWVRLGR
jgi:hypothetical protein